MHDFFSLRKRFSGLDRIDFGLCYSHHHFIIPRGKGSQDRKQGSLLIPFSCTFIIMVRSLYGYSFSVGVTSGKYRALECQGSLRRTPELILA
jgi:hypothetical protein